MLSTVGSGYSLLSDSETTAAVAEVAEAETLAAGSLEVTVGSVVTVAFSSSFNDSSFSSSV